MHPIPGNGNIQGNIGIISQDIKLIGALRSVLAFEFTILTLPAQQSAERAIAEHIDAVIIDVADACEYPKHFEGTLAELVGAHLPVIVMADDDTLPLALEMMEKGAHICVRKPPAMRELRMALHKVCDRFGTEARRDLNLTGLDHLVGSGAQMQLVYKLVRKVANLDASVLITGESGTGKELVARAIHNTGNRARRPFVAVSCGAIPDTLIEAELFGHEKGAYTGTAGSREGYLEEAGDGTLFLDEIGELNQQTQVKLLRVLQEREFNRLGATRPIPLRCRIVLATNRDLDQMVAAGEFRGDLFYRIDVLNIKVPPLHAHPEDIPLLVPHFIKKYSHSYRKPIEGIEPRALALMQAYTWPGNVRELENAVQHAIIMAEGDTIQEWDLPEALCDVEPQDLENDELSGSFERQLRDFKIKLALDAIEHCNGNKTLAAQSLSISRAYLHRLIRLAPSAAAGTNVSDIGETRVRLGVAS